MRFITILLSIFVYINSAIAQIWISPENTAAKSDIEYLAHSGIIKSPISTYPMLWKDIINDINYANNLSKPQQLAKNRLLHLFHDENTHKLSVYVGSSKQKILSQSIQTDQQFKLNYLFKEEFGSFSAQIDLDLANGQIGHSYLSYSLNNWLLYVGAVPQFWGPSQDTSLIFTNYSQPIPAMGIQRISSSPFKLPILNLLGNWNFKSQMAQLESKRSIPNTKVWSTRFAIKPVQQLEISASLVAMWAGDNQPSEFDDFFDIMTGKEFCINGEATCHHSLQTKAGNQLASVEVMWQDTLNDYPYSLYVQRVGEDAPTTGILPSDKINLFGVSAQLPLEQKILKIFVEYADTNLSCGSTSAQNCLYEHSTYLSGYRYEGIPIGSVYDNDTTSLIFGLSLRKGLTDSWLLKFKKLNINQDNSDSYPDDLTLGNTLSKTKTDIDLISLDYKKTWKDEHKTDFYFVLITKGELIDQDEVSLGLKYTFSY